MAAPAASPSARKCLKYMQQAINEQTILYRKEVDDLKNQLMTLQKVLAQKDKKIEGLQRSCNSTAATCSELEVRVREAEAAVMNQSFTDAENEVMVLSAQVSEYQITIKRLETELKLERAAAKANDAGTKDEDQALTTLKQQNVDLKAALRRKRKQCKMLRARICSQQEREYEDADVDEEDGSPSQCSDEEDLGAGADDESSIDEDELMDTAQDDSADDSSFDGDALLQEEDGKKKKLTRGQK